MTTLVHVYANCTRLLLGLVAVLGFVAAPAAALAPGPWKLVAQGVDSGRSPSVLVRGRWTYSDENGPSSGIVEHYPIPKRMAFVVQATAGHRIHVAWTAMCYPNGERPRPTRGTASGVGKLTIYPTLYAQRVECDPYVTAHLVGRGTLRVRIFAF